MKQLVLVSVMVLFGCAVGPDFQTPAPPEAQPYTRDAPASAAQTFPAADTATPMWWNRFHSDALDRLVDEALQQSPTLAQARAKLIEARENYNAQAGATAFPSVDATISGTRQQVNLASFGIPNVSSPGPFSLFDASVSVSYTFDIFGGNRRALEATMAQVDYERFELEAARLSIAGNVVASAVRRASLQEQISLTRRLTDAQAQQLAIVDARHAAGGVSQLDVRSQRTLLAQTRASLPPLETQLAQADHQLAILLGRPPSKANFDALTLDSLQLPADVPLTLPSTLARERPDIRASEALLHQASANIGVATANLYPQFSLSAGIGSQRTNIQDVVSGLNVWNIGLNLAQPLFHGGELRAKKRSAQAAYDAALAAYQQTVLQALQQVADTLTALQNDARELQSREDAAREAQASFDIAHAQYEAGGVSQFSVLDAERQTLQTALDRTRAQADRFADTAALFQSLGGATQADALAQER
ncbi:RND efflux system outer membrane lipoprotein [Caballeronia arationis]|jgi:NodT family efflux transporter outer membrane factor (OMF) lipoprotein|uniref:Efflux transporter, outer membrane factor (OMF) lipoprotein, NodT family n=1 Tax=Caballeronia arationis TaxID=1777142 RepID=A0A7Z7N771_9BURK|nr:efflux transporter outer membrane subunit [Caballeronia arationis]SAK64086.1 RND efflux system outer membrane lipoprotein [Caballeronia arationis]SOE88694.1 efflux transporter, outer membrane factor (OMF) lipoprotein, NodT family [Caballeronia arationis]